MYIKKLNVIGKLIREKSIYNIQKKNRITFHIKQRKDS